MIDEPYRWVEAISNRREYIEHQLAAGSPIVALSYAEGVLLFTLSRERQKIFEIYDRIAMGGIGHPGDIERLRLAAIELCSTEGFARSAHDVSLRRLANYSLSPSLKAAFEQVYGPPYLARLLFAEVGRANTPDLFLRLDYDGSIRTNGGVFSVHQCRLSDRDLRIASRLAPRSAFWSRGRSASPVAPMARRASHHRPRQARRPPPFH